MATLGSNVASIQLDIIEGEKPDKSLESSLLCSIFFLSGAGKIGRDLFQISMEEMLDLIFHVNKLISGREDEFEWRTVDGAVQLFRIFKDAKVLRVEAGIMLQGTSAVEMQFDTSKEDLRSFGNQLEVEMKKTLHLDNKQLKSLEDELEKKVLSIRTRKRHPYHRARTI